MKGLILTLVLVGSFSTFAAQVEDNAPTDGVICSAEQGKTAVEATSSTSTTTGESAINEG